jgi:hypothetical protein
MSHVSVEVYLDGTRHNLRWPRDVADGPILGCQALPVSDDVHIEY